MWQSAQTLYFITSGHIDMSRNRWLNSDVGAASECPLWSTPIFCQFLLHVLEGFEPPLTDFPVNSPLPPILFNHFVLYERHRMSSAIGTITRAALSGSYPTAARGLATAAPRVKKARKEGDISSVFVSLSGDGASGPHLPERFVAVKNQLLRDNRDAVTASWTRLLNRLSEENQIVKERGSSIVPQINFEDLDNPPAGFSDELKKRGVAVIRGVVPESEARTYKDDIQQYVRDNPWTKGNPDTAVKLFGKRH